MSFLVEREEKRGGKKKKTATTGAKKGERRARKLIYSKVKAKKCIMLAITRTQPSLGNAQEGGGGG